jgi:hypothetical protein
MPYVANYSRQAWLFVGKRRAPRTPLLTLTWQDLARCSHPLHEALAVLPLRGSVMYVSLSDAAGDPQEGILPFVRGKQEEGWMIVGLGRTVQAALTEARIPHAAVRHPAVRVRIATRVDYHAHVATVLKQWGAVF